MAHDGGSGHLGSLDIILLIDHGSRPCQNDAMSHAKMQCAINVPSMAPLWHIDVSSKTSGLINSAVSIHDRTRITLTCRRLLSQSRRTAPASGRAASFLRLGINTSSSFLSGVKPYQPTRGPGGKIKRLMARRLNRLQRLGQVGDQVFGVLDADREADHRGRDAELAPGGRAGCRSGSWRPDARPGSRCRRG